MSTPGSRETFAGSNVSVEPPRSAVSPSAAATTIWLDALVRSLDLPAQERHQIRLELQSHIEDRVRDLMLEGKDEAESTRRALGECGEASSLANGFGEVKRALRRRTLMNIGVVGAACGLVVFGLGSLRAQKCPPEELAAQQRAQAAAAAQHAGAASAQNTALTYESVLRAGRGTDEGLTYNLAAAAGRAQNVGAAEVAQIKSTGLEDVLQFMSAQSGQPVAINWASLKEAGLERTTIIDATIPKGDIEEMIAVLNDVIGSDPENGPGPLAVRERNGMYEIASAAWIDKHDVQLDMYDLTSVIEAGVNAEQLQAAIVQFVEPSNWRENGGERATLSIVGTRLIVKAPSRMHERVRWMIDQFSHAADNPFGQPAQAMPADPTVGNVAIQHADAEAVSHLVQAYAAKTELDVKVAADSAGNQIVMQGKMRDIARCQELIAIIDGAMGGKAQINHSKVPVLGDLPILSAIFQKSSATVDLAPAEKLDQPVTEKIDVSRGQNTQPATSK